MRRLLSLTVTAALAGGFLVADVVSLPTFGATAPRVQSIALAGTLSAADPEASPAPSQPAAGAASADGATAAPDPAAPAATPVAPVDPAPSATPGTAPDTGATGTPAGTAVTEPTATETAVTAPSAAEPATAEPVVAEDGVLETGVLETEDFTVAGVTWSPGGEAPSSVEVRVREDDGWSEWTELATADDGPDAGTEEFELASGVVGTDPLVTDGADAVEVRIATADGTTPDDLEVSLIDPGTSVGDEVLESSTPITSADAAATRPSIISRAAWGADESLRRCSPSYSSSLEAATLHHTAGTNNYTASGSAAVVRGIYAYHTRSLGWCDVGYNFLVDKFGRIYEGRAGGVDRAVRGAHAGGFNNQTVGISLMGNFDLVKVPEVAKDAVTAVVEWKLGTADVDPEGTTTLTSAGGSSARFSSGSKVTLPTVFAHKDVGKTACPGRYGLAILPAVRKEAGSLSAIQAYVTAVYVDMLKRGPDPTGMTNWTSMIEANGGNATPMMGQFTGSVEYRNRQINEAYRLVLNRGTDSVGLLNWRTKVIKGQASLEDISVELLLSQEFYNRGGGNDRGFLRLLHTAVVGRTPDTATLASLEQQLRTKGRRATVESVWGSYDATGRRVDALYREFLFRGVDPTGYATWTSLAQTRGDYWVRDQLVLSVEYRSKSAARY